MDLRLINRREWLLGSMGAPLALVSSAAARRPNVIVILADDMGFADAGFQGCKDYPTPNLDRLARRGVRFTNGYVSHPFCSPTRAGILTGRYQQRYGHENNPVYDPKDELAGLPVTELSLVQVLSDAGYATGLVGKWHLGAARKFHPMRRGFREMYGFLGGGHDYFKTEMEGAPREYLIPIERDGKPEPLRSYLTDALSEEAEAFVKRHRSEPFFLYLAYNAPHTPQQVPDEYLARVAKIADERRRKYAAMMCALDDGVGRVLRAVESNKLERDTLIIFLSDNGGPVSVNGSSNAPWRGAKGQVLEGGIRVPFVMQWSGRLPEGKTFDHPVISLDILPTALGAAGLKPPAGRSLDGADLIPYLTGRSTGAPHQRLYWRTGGGAAYAVREGRFKWVRIGEREQLFDLQEDIGEARDISASQPQVAARLKDACMRWDRELVAPVFESPRGGQAKKGAK
jgi:arylsulfatase A-like enzyme